MQIIYALVDPRTDREFYIGRTEDLYRRFKEHLSCAGRNDEKNTRIKELESLYLVPVMRTLEIVENDAMADIRESHWIRHYLSTGVRLVNLQINKPLAFDTFVDIMKGFGSPSGQLEVEIDPSTIEIELVPIEDFMYHIDVKGVRRKRTYISYEEATRCTGYTQEELRMLVKRGKIKQSYDREKLILASLRVKPYFGTNILRKR
jgi:hypothetical protein